MKLYLCWEGTLCMNGAIQIEVYGYKDAAGSIGLGLGLLEAQGQGYMARNLWL